MDRTDLETLSPQDLECRRRVLCELERSRTADLWSAPAPPSEDVELRWFQAEIEKIDDLIDPDRKAREHRIRGTIQNEMLEVYSRYAS